MIKHFNFFKKQRLRTLYKGTLYIRFTSNLESFTFVYLYIRFISFIWNYIQ